MPVTRLDQIELNAWPEPRDEDHWAFACPPVHWLAAKMAAPTCVPMTCPHGVPKTGLCIHCALGIAPAQNPYGSIDTRPQPTERDLKVHRAVQIMRQT